MMNYGFSVDIYTDNGTGKEVHPKSGTYSAIALSKAMPDILAIENLFQVDIIPDIV